MSVRVMSLVWDSDLPRDEKFIALCLADFGNDEGDSIYPGIGYIVWKTGYSESRVKMILRSLREKRIISVDFEKSKYGTNEYKLFLDRFPKRPPYVPNKIGRPEKVGSKINPGFSDDKVGSVLEKVGSKTDPNPLGLTVSSNREISETTPISTPAVLMPDRFDPNTSAGRARTRIAAALQRGAYSAESIESDLTQHCRISPNMNTKSSREFIAWLKDRPGSQTLQKFSEWWFRSDWRGKNGQPPNLGQIRELWPQAFPVQAQPHNNQAAVQGVITNFIALRDREPTQAELADICSKKGLIYEPSMAG